MNFTRVPPQYNFHNRSQKQIAELLELEEHWSAIITDVKGLTRRESRTMSHKLWVIINESSMTLNSLKVDEDDRDSIMIQEAIWEIFKTERSYMNGVQNIHFRSKNITGSTLSILPENVKLTSNRRLTDVWLKIAF